ncbi:MAG: NADH-quinone oxidoreductase subunit NuoE [Anaerolineales bacterium]|nr:NADH-quinone oxidoreductase subunit NuoE [Anaerolineales bacterium]
MLAEKYRSEIDDILDKYPIGQKRSAVMPLLYLAQREYGSITRAAIDEIAELLSLDATEVASLVGFYTLFHEEPGGRYRVQVCTDLPCALRGADAFVEELCERLGIQSGETTPDGLITVEEVKCLAACDRAPMFQLQDREGIHYHEHQTVDLAMALIEELRKRESDA